MIVTEFYNGQGLGNQLWCYVVTRALAMDRNFDFGIKSPEKFKGGIFMNVDFGKAVIGGSGPEGGPPKSLPEGIRHYYKEKKVTHPVNGADISVFDHTLMLIADNTKLDGNFQDEQYIIHHKNDIREWLKVKEEYECYDFSNENICVINFRGGEYTEIPSVLLKPVYYQKAVENMLRLNPKFRFVVITDDVKTAKSYFPTFDVFHFNIAKDYVVIKNAQYLILSNSSFAWFPAWLNTNLKYCIAPKYWWAHNESDGYWACGYNITSNWMYQTRGGELQTYEHCLKELQGYNYSRTYLYQQSELKIIFNNLSSQIENIFFLLKGKVKRLMKPDLLIKSTNKHLAHLLLVTKNLFIKKLSPSELVKYKKNIHIYDAFYFFNELDILEIRLNVLDPYVDYFVIIEATETFTGLPRKSTYLENKYRFKKFEHKIIHHITTDTPIDEADLRRRLLNSNISALDREIITNTLTTDNVPKNEVYWLKEFYQKEMLKKALVGLSDNDFVLISDVDEIWNPQILLDVSSNELFKFKQTAYYYFLNNRSNDDWETGWTGTVATKYENIKNSCVNHLRTHSKNIYTVIENGGWHFTFQGGSQRIKEKLASYGHKEFNTPDIIAQLDRVIQQNIDYRGRNLHFWVDESELPEYIINNKDLYPDLFRNF